MALSVIVIVAFTITYITRSAHAQLQINPKELELTDGISNSSVVMSCAAPPGVTIYEISLTHFTPQTGRKLVTAVAGVNQGLPTFEPHTDLTQYNANLTGGVGQGSITLQLKQPKCEDPGLYLCSIVYSNGTGSPFRQTLHYTENLTFTVASGNITSSVSPNLEFYVVDDTVTLECIAIVSNSQLDKSNWTWEYYDASSMAWRPYLSPDFVGIEKYFDQVPGTCTYLQPSYLIHKIKAEDSQKQYRCTWQKNEDKKWAIITIGTVSPDAYRPYVGYITTPAPHVNAQNTCTCTCIYTCPAP